VAEHRTFVDYALDVHATAITTGNARLDRDRVHVGDWVEYRRTHTDQSLPTKMMPMATTTVMRVLRVEADHVVAGYAVDMRFGDSPTKVAAGEETIRFDTYESYRRMGEGQQAIARGKEVVTVPAGTIECEWAKYSFDHADDCTIVTFWHSSAVPWDGIVKWVVEHRRKDSASVSTLELAAYGWGGETAKA
jgi:hypothetical protein